MMDFPIQDIKRFMRSFRKLFFFLFVLPCVVTYFHLRMQLFIRQRLFASDTQSSYPQFVIVTEQGNDKESYSGNLVGMYQKISEQSAGSDIIAYVRIKPKRASTGVSYYNSDHWEIDTSWNIIQNTYYEDVIEVSDFISGISLQRGDFRKKSPPCILSTKIGIPDRFQGRFCFHTIASTFPPENMQQITDENSHNDYSSEKYEMYCRRTSESEVTGAYFNIHNNRKNNSLYVTSLYEYYYSNDAISTDEKSRRKMLSSFDERYFFDAISSDGASLSNYIDQSNAIDNGWNCSNDSSRISGGILNHANIPIPYEHNANAFHRYLVGSSGFNNNSSSRRFFNNPNSFMYRILIKMPATALLVALNVGLALYYFNNRVNPDSVAKVYSLMMGSQQQKYEIWRCFTGATAHFEIWHLGVNMMSLYSLGEELEGRLLYPSVSFLFYNISLIPVVTAIWLLLKWSASKIRFSQQQRQLGTSMSMSEYISDDLNQPTVGYSGVLFAWMVVASLEQQSTCPIFFLPSLCFKTYSLFGGWFKFSFGPLVQLVVLQVILPRVSFSGHLAGIVAGFAIHWGLLPIQYTQPAIVIPILYLMYLRSIRRFPISIPSMASLHSSTETSNNNEAFVVSASPHLIIFRLQLLIAFCSVLCFGLVSSLSLSFVLGVIFWWLSGSKSCQNVNDCQFGAIRTISMENSNPPPSVVLSRGFVVSAILVLVTDSMTFGSWLTLPFTLSPYSCTVICLRWIIFVLSIIRLVSTSAVGPLDEEGIFNCLFGFTVLNPCKALRDHPWFIRLTQDSQSNSRSDIEIPSIESWAPFNGSGRVLGSSSVSSGARRGSDLEMSRLVV